LENLSQICPQIKVILSLDPDPNLATETPRKTFRFEDSSGPKNGPELVLKWYYLPEHPYIDSLTRQIGFAGYAPYSKFAQFCHKSKFCFNYKYMRDLALRFKGFI